MLLASLLATAVAVHVAESRLVPATGSHAQDQRPLLGHAEEPGTPFKWTDIKPKPHFDFHDCFDGWQCARLEVPMDWNATDAASAADKVALAIVKRPARVPVTDPRYAGPILINPGGPGGSGMALFWRESEELQTVADGAYSKGHAEYINPNDEDARFYDILTWDPRGINNSTPFQTCFTDPRQFVVWGLRSERRLLGTPEADFNYNWALHAAEGQGCIYDPVTNPTGSKIANYMTTAYHVRDMVEIIERHGEWREKHARSLGASASQLEAVAHRPGEEKLNYWGYSYGTVLGATFATLQPHRVQRVLLSGVVDSADYYSGEQKTVLRDTDKVVNRFFTYCADAGPERCPLWNGPTAEDTEARLQWIINDLETTGPIAVPGNSFPGSGPEIITASDVLILIMGFNYRPWTLAELLAALVAPLSHRNGTLFAIHKQTTLKSVFPAMPSLPPPQIDPYEPATRYHDWVFEEAGFQAIYCSDAAYNRTKESFTSYWRSLQRQSKYQGDEWAWLLSHCASWPAQPKWRYGHAAGEPIASNVTAHPILFASNLYDNVTPLSSARSMHVRFKGSGLVVVDGEGHCAESVASLPYARIVRRYFQTGAVPGRETFVRVHERPFLGKEGKGLEELPERLEGEDRALYEAVVSMRGIVQTVPESARGEESAGSIRISRVPGFT